MQSGVCFLILAMLLTPAVDGVAKILSAEHTPMMIAFLRYLTAGTIALAIARSTGRRIEVARGDRLGQLLRTALIMGAMTALISALGMVPGLAHPRQDRPAARRTAVRSGGGSLPSGRHSERWCRHRLHQSSVARRPSGRA